MEARNRFLPEWFNRIRTGQLRLPRFQRFEAWSYNEVAGLLENVLRGLPCGATLILEVGDKELFISRPVVGAPSPTERVTEHLLDGQQRLTALWRSLHDNYEDRTYFVSLKDDKGSDGEIQAPRVIAQARWRKNGQRYPVWADNPEQVFRRGYIPVRLLCPGDVSGDEIIDWCDAATKGSSITGRDLERTVWDLRRTVETYNIPFLSLPVGTPKSVALDVFIKMNTSSVALSAFDIVVAQVEAATGQPLHDLVSELKACAPAVNEYADPSDLILSVAALRQDHAPTQASYQRLEVKDFVSEWSQIVEGIRWAIEFLESEAIFDSQRLPTGAVIPVLATLYDVVPSSLDTLGNARALLRKYLWRAFLTRRYENSAATHSLQDLRGLRAILRDGQFEDKVPIFDESEFPLPSPEELKRAGWPKAKDILARGILAVTIRMGAPDIADGTPASRAHLAKREYHHLFPNALLTEEGELSSQEIFRALNCALFTWNTNRNISAKEPLRYLRERTERSALGEDEIRSRLSKHLIPFDALAVGGYEQVTDKAERARRVKEDYEHFLDERAGLLVTPIRKLCNGQTL